MGLPPISNMPTPNAPTRLMVFMFTDVVGSTAIKSQFGTRTYAQLLARHDELFREAIGEAHGSSEISQDTGDGHLVSLNTASAAVRCALRFQHSLAIEAWLPTPLQVRIGIHVGEVVEVPTGDRSKAPKFAGLAVDLASRVMSLATGGQILMTRMVFDEARQFVAEHPVDADPASPPSTLNWVAHGPYRFKGVDEPVDVFGVGRDPATLIQPADSEKAKRVVTLELEQMLGWRPAIGLHIPQRAGWTLQKELGGEGDGEVWLAGSGKMRTRRVFKFCFDPDCLRKLKREVTLFRLLREALGERPDIARLYDVKLDQAPFYLESEYTDGGNLADWAAAQGGIGTIPIPTRLDFVARIADAVNAAHSVGIVHKDIRPSNVLIYYDSVTRKPLPRLSNFGYGMLADRTELTARHISTSGFTHSTQNHSRNLRIRMYAPPEVLAGRPFSIQGDVYSLGVLFYQMVVGDLDRPLGVGWERAIDDALLRDDVRSCIEATPERRLKSPAEVAARIRSLNLRRQEMVEPPAAVPARQATPQMQPITPSRKKLIAIAITVITLIAIAAAAYLVRSHDRARQLAELNQQLDESLKTDGWSQSYVEKLDDLGRRIGEISPDSRDATRHRIYSKYADSVSRSMRRPLTVVDMAMLSMQIAQIESVDPALADPLRKQLADRQSPDLRRLIGLQSSH